MPSRKPRKKRSKQKSKIKIKKLDQFLEDLLGETRISSREGKSVNRKTTKKPVW